MFKVCIDVAAASGVVATVMVINIVAGFRHPKGKHARWF